MVITQLTGGLGNQLFQYAAGKSLALQHGVALKCDVNFFGGQAMRSLDLDFFQTAYAIATDQEIKNLLPKNLFQKSLQRLLPVYNRSVYREPFFHYDARFHTAKSAVYLKGNWQSEKYFKKFEQQIRDDLRIKDKYVERLQPIAGNLKSLNSVSVHIRRGDYLQQKFLAYHGILSKAYYNNAIALIKQQAGDVVFYFFSDDIAWVKENIALDMPHHFVSGSSTTNAIEDFYLMQSCRHHIIANSSFSWWAAWLNNYAKKTVIAPKQWFNQGPKDTQDLIPDSWIRI